MLKLMRNVYFGQKCVRGILSNRGLITSLDKCNYSTTIFENKGKPKSEEEPNPAGNIGTAAVNDNNKTTLRKQNVTSPKITVISSDQKLTIMTLEEARKLSKRRDLRLIKVMDVDHMTPRPVYKLMTGAEYFQEDLNHRKEKSLRKINEQKDPKLLTLSSNISDHDLGSKIKNIIKWLNKRHEVRVVINCNENEDAAELISKTIESETKHAGKMVQKRKKGDDLKFQLLSLKRNAHNSNDKNSGESEAGKTDLET